MAEQLAFSGFPDQLSLSLLVPPPQLPLSTDLFMGL